MGVTSVYQTCCGDKKTINNDNKIVDFTIEVKDLLYLSLIINIRMPM